MKRAFLGIVTCLILAIILVACETIGATYLADERYDPRPNNWPIQILQKGTRVTKDFIVLAQLSAYYTPPTIFSTMPDSFMEKLREKARSIGGDAIMDLDIFQAPAGTVREYTYTIQGKIVRWK